MKSLSGRTRRAQAICASTFGVALCATPLAADTTWEVCMDGACDFSDIQSAINAASDGDVIEIAAGTYYLTETLEVLDKVITLRGASNAAGDRLTIISGDVDNDGEGDVRVLFCETINALGAPEFVNLVFQDGAALGSDDGGGGDGIGGFVGGGAASDDGEDGGGAYIWGNGPTFINCLFLNNEAEGNGGGIYYDATSRDNTAPVFRYCDFEGNEAGVSGGGMFNDVYGGLLISDCTFLSNTATDQAGGAIYNRCWYGNTRIERVEFTENSAALQGGGLWSRSPVNGGIQVTDCTFRGNEAANTQTNGEGGGMYFTTYDECNHATMLLLNEDQLGDVAAGDTILVRVGVGPEGGSGLGSLKISMVPRLSHSHGLVFEDEDTGTIDAPIEIDGLGGNTVIVPLEIDPGGSHWIVGCDGVADDPDLDADYEVSVDDNPLGMWLEITIPEDFDAQSQVIAVGSCTPAGLSDIFIAAYKQVGEVDGAETYQRFAYVSDDGDNGCSNGGDYPNNAKSCLGSYILVNNSGTYTTPDGAEPVIKENNAEHSGGGIYSFDCDIEVFGCSFELNTSGLWGGGICSWHQNYAAAEVGEQWLVALPFPKLVGCTFRENHAGVEGEGQGGGFFGKSQWSLYMADCVFEENKAIGPDSSGTPGGGGLFASGSTLRLSNCSFTNNEAVSDSGKMGGGMCNVGTFGLTMENCRFEGNLVTRRGGGLYNDGSGLTTLTDCTFLDNEVEGTSGDGGGMYSSISGSEEDPVGVLLENCTFRGNQAIGAFAEGGGLFHNGSSESGLWATGCLFTENSAEHEGGGVRSPSSSPAALILTETRVCGNTPEQISGVWTDNGCNTVEETCVAPCHADFDGDGIVGVNDLLAFLAVFGTIPDDTGCGVGFDLNQDGLISVDDLLLFLTEYGNACNGGAPRKVRPDGGSMSGRPGTASGG